MTRPGENSRAGFDSHYLQNLLNIWTPSNIATSLKSEESEMSPAVLYKSIASVAHEALDHPMIRAMAQDNLKSQFAVKKSTSLSDISANAWEASYLSRNDARFVIQEALAPPISVVCSSRTFLEHLKRSRQDPITELAMYGLPPPECEDPNMVARVRKILPGLPPAGLVSTSPACQTPLASMRFPNMKRLIFDSAKLARLDSLLRELKQGGHRVLIYFQMTRMMSIMEEYLVYRQYKYLRLDGSTAIGDRRDMVNAWQTKLVQVISSHRTRLTDHTVLF